MASHILTGSLGTGNYAFSMAPFGSTLRYKAGSLRLVSAATTGTFIVKPIVVSDADPDPTAATLSLASNAMGATSSLSGDQNPSLMYGQKYAKGFSSDAQGAPVATHLLVTCTVAGLLQMEVD